MISDYKEVFQLMDKDQDGIISFQELSLALRALGQRPSGFQWNYKLFI